MPNHKVGDLIVSFEGDKEYYLGQVQKIVDTAYGKRYKIMWLDGWEDGGDNTIDENKLITLKHTYKEYCKKNGIKYSGTTKK